MKLVSKVTEIYCVANYCCPVKVLQDKKNKAETLL